MYIIAIIVFFVIICVVLGFNMGQIAMVLDPISLICILLLTIPLLAVSGLLRDLFRGFGIAFKKNQEYEKKQISRSLEAVSLTVKLIQSSGILTSLLGAITILIKLDDPALLGPSLAVCILSLLYAVIMTMILLPVKVKLKMKLEKWE